MKFDFVRELHAITIPPPLQLRENVKIIAVSQTMYNASQRTSIAMQHISRSAPLTPTSFLLMVYIKKQVVNIWAVTGIKYYYSICYLHPKWKEKKKYSIV